MVKYKQIISRYKSSKFFWLICGLGFFLLSAFIGLLINNYLLSSRIIQKTGAHLQAIGQERKMSILQFIDEQRTRIATLSHDERLITLSQALFETYQVGLPGDYKNASPEFKEYEKKLDQYLNQQNVTYQFKDIMLIDLSGKIFYTFKNNMINVDLASAAFNNSNLAQSFERTRMTLTNDISEFSVDPALNAPALYMLRPLFKADKLVAILAIQVDDSQLYKIVQNYNDLGRTGDIFVTKSMSGRVMFVAPSRLYSDVSFKKITDPSKEENTPTRLGTAGKTGYGYLLDAYGVPVIASWTFIPQVNLGLSVGIQYSEAIASLWWYTFFAWILGILCLLYILLVAHFLGHLRFLKPLRDFIFSQFFFKLLLWIFSIAMLAASGLIFWQRYSQYKNIVDQTIITAQSKIHTQVESIAQNMQEIEKIAAMIAQDLKTQTLKKEDIPIRLLRDLKEVPDIENISVAFAPFAYDPQQRLHGFEAKKIDDVPHVNPISYDYMVAGSSELVQADWYNKAIKEGGGWSEAVYDAQKNSRTVYTLPFYLPSRAEPAGVIAITYNLKKIINAVKSIEIGKMGYAMLISANGQLIYHPLDQYLKDKQSLGDIGTENNNQELRQIAEKMLKQNAGIANYSDNSGNYYWFVYKRVPHINWHVVITFSHESLPLPSAKLRKQLIWGFILLVIGLLLLSMIVARVWQGMVGIRRWAILSGAVLAAALIFFWDLTRMAPYESADNSVIIRDQTSLDKYLELLDIEAQQRNEKRPVAIPTGLILYTLNFPDSNRVSVSGYVWQKVAENITIKPGVLLPEASENSFKEIFRKKENGVETIGWNMSATFLQRYRYSFFPLDKVHINIVLASTDFENNVILTPDFSGYKSYDVDPFPGISNNISVAGFLLARSFFSFTVIPPYDEVGLDALRDVTEKVRLHYNVILKRKLINPLIIFMLPLLIILFSIYAVFLVTQRWRGYFDAFKSLGAYTGLFFSLIILHQTLRNQVQSGDLLYIEYFFFFTYVTILLLVLNTLLLQITRTANFLNEKVSPYLKILFWPLQFAFWFAITMIIFYSVR